MSDWTQEWLDNELHTEEGGQPVTKNLQEKMNGSEPETDDGKREISKSQQGRRS